MGICFVLLWNVALWAAGPVDVSSGKHEILSNVQDMFGTQNKILMKIKGQDEKRKEKRKKKYLVQSEKE